MRGGTPIVILVLLGLLGAAGWFAYSGMSLEGDPMPTQGYIALSLGIVFSIVVGVGLMALVFYSNRRGYDEPPRTHEDD